MHEIEHGSIIAASAEVAHDVRPERVGDGERGSRRHSAINARYFGFSGLFCGTASRAEKPVFVVQAASARSPSSS